MRFKLVFLDFKYRISFSGNFTVYKWRVTKVAHCIFLFLKIDSVTANSAGPDKIRSYAAFHMGLKCLPFSALSVSSHQIVILFTHFLLLC